MQTGQFLDKFIEVANTYLFTIVSERLLIDSKVFEQTFLLAWRKFEETFDQVTVNKILKIFNSSLGLEISPLGIFYPTSSDQKLAQFILKLI